MERFSGLLLSFRTFREISDATECSSVFGRCQISRVNRPQKAQEAQKQKFISRTQRCGIYFADELPLNPRQFLVPTLRLL